MHKIFTRRLLSLALIVCALTMSAEKRSVYVLSDFAGWVWPTEQNAEYYEQFKIYETSEGSNVYEGVVKNVSGTTLSSVKFRFKTEMSPNTASNPLWYDNIAPFVDQVNCEQNGAVAIAKQAQYKAYASREPGNWNIGDLYGCNAFKVILDMNTGNVAVLLNASPMAVLNTEDVPSPFDAADCIYSGEGCKFVEAGPLSFYLYDFFTGTKYGAESAEAANLNDNICTLKKVVDGQPWTVEGWTGGVLSFSDNKVTLDCPDIPNGAPSYEITSGLWLTGNFNSWNFSDNYKMTADGEAYVGTLPKGTKEFRINNQDNWDGVSLTPYSPLAPVGSTCYYMLTPNNVSGNITNPYPEEEVNLWLDPKSLVLAIWPASAGEREGSVPSDLSYSIFEYTPIPGALYVLNGSEPAIPTKDNVKYVYRYLQYLQPDGNGWSGNLDLQENANIRFANPETGEILCPGEKNRDLKVSSDKAYSSYVTLPAERAAYWRVTRDGNANVTVKSNSTGYDALTVEYPLTKRVIYLAGTPSGWVEPSQSNEAAYANWKLEETGDGGYYGAFQMPAAPMFRFYPELNGWNSLCYGAYGGTNEDSPVPFPNAFQDSQDFYWRLAATSDSFSFPNWTKGDMYIYVAPNFTSVTISQKPINVEVGSQDSNAGKIFCSIDNEEKYPLEKIGEGRYACNISRSTKPHELRLYNKLLGVDSAEPESLGSYAYQIAAEDAMLDNFDALGVAESKFGEISDISAEDPGAFIIPALRPNDYTYISQLVVDTNTGKVYLDSQNYAVLSGAFNNNAVPTYENRAEFYPYAIALGEYTRFDIPAGQFDFGFATLRYGLYSSADNEVEVMFDESGIFDSQKVHFMYGLRNARLKIADWEGGKLLFSGYGSLANLNQVTSISYTDGGQVKEAKETAEGSNIFEFTTYPVSSSETYSYFNMFLGKEKTLQLQHRNNMGFMGVGISSNMDWSLGRVKLADNEASVPLGFGYSLYFNQIGADTQLKVRVDLNNLTADMQVIDGNANATYTIFSSDEENAEEELVQSLDQPELVIGAVEVASAPEEAVEFNFGASDGSVMVPAGNKEILFDENGFWTGEYTTVQSTLQVRRRTASLSDKWSLPEGFNGKVLININQETRQITLSAPAENKGFLLLPLVLNEYGYTETTFSPSKLSEYANKAMERDAEGNFTMVIKDTEANGFVICKGIQPNGYSYAICEGIFARDTADKNIVLGSAGATADVLTIYSDSPYNAAGDYFRYTIPEGSQLKVDYDHNLGVMHLSSVESSGTEEIVVDNDAPVEYYNLQGLRIAKPLPGTICIRRQGANVAKIIVR